MKIKKSFSVVFAVLLFFGLFTANTFAANTFAGVKTPIITDNIDMTANTDATADAAETFANTSVVNIIGVDAATDTVLLPGAKLRIDAPAGYKFVKDNGSGAWTALVDGDITIDTAGNTTNDAATLFDSDVDNSGNAVFAAASGKVVTDASGNVVAFYVTGGTAGIKGNETVWMNLGHAGSSDVAIALQPISATANPTGTDLKLTATFNYGTSSASSVTFGDNIDVLTAPVITRAEVVDAATAKVYFNVPVAGLDTADFTSDFTIAGATGTPAGTQTASTDKLSTTLTLTAGSFKTDGTTTVKFAGTGVVKSSSDSGTISNNTSTAAVHMLPTDASITSVEADKTTIGPAVATKDDILKVVNGSINVPSLQKLINLNTITFTIQTAAAGTPFALKLYDMSSTLGTAVGHDLDARFIVSSSVQTDADGLDIDNGDYYDSATGELFIPGALNVTGTVFVKLAIASDGADGAVNANKKLALAVSTDNFVSKTLSEEITQDTTAPVVATNGAQVIDSNTIQVTFNEALFEDAATLASNYVVIYNTTGNTTTSAANVEDDFAGLPGSLQGTDVRDNVDTAVLSDDGLTVTLTTAAAIPAGSKVTVYAKDMAQGVDASATTGLKDVHGRQFDNSAANAASIMANMQSAGLAVTSATIAPKNTLLSGYTSTAAQETDSNKIRVKASVNSTSATVTAALFPAATEESTITNAGWNNLDLVNATLTYSTTTGMYEGDLTIPAGQIDGAALTVYVSADDFVTKVQAIPAEITVDKVAPKMTSAVSYGGNTVQAVFSEPLLASTVASDGTDFIIKETSTGTALSVTKAELSTDKKSVVITTAAQTVDTNYTVYIKNGEIVSDLAGNQQTGVATTSSILNVQKTHFTGTAVDTVAPVATVAVNAAGAIEVTVTDADGALAAASQSLTVRKDGAVVPGVIVKTSTGVDTVTLALTPTNPLTSGDTYTAEGSIEDVAGNQASYSLDIVYTAPVAVNATPATVTIAVADTSTITVADGAAPYTIVSDDETVATVSAATLDVAGSFDITGVAEGTATITVTDANNDTATVAVTVTAAVAPIPAPVGQNTAELTGDEIADAPVNMGSVATGTGSQMQLSMNFPAYDAAVDIYVGVQLPDGTLYLLDSDEKLTTALVPYATGVTAAKTATVFDAFNVCTPFGTPAVPTGTWHAYTVVAPTNDGDFNAIDWAEGDYDLQYYSFDVSCGE